MARKRRSLFYKFTIVMLLFIGGLIVYLFFNNIRQLFNLEDRESSFTMYPGFGIAMPDGYEIHGIDVSRYQKRVNWPVVKVMAEKHIRLGFAFIKATEGVTFTDAQFKRNWRKIRETGITRGAYHYLTARGSGKLQAQHFINTVTILHGDLPPVLDVESLDGASVTELQQFVQDWLQTVEAYYKVKPIIYSNAAFYNRYLDGKFSDYPLWVAHYLEQHQPRVSRHWNFWQHNESGRVNGIDAFVDFNVFNGDSTDFRALLVR
ncbi:glycoside hydrolase family 25 protein [soil metagenome]